MPSPSSLPLPVTEALSLSQVWSAEAMAAADGAAISTGFAPLDAELPGGGWPLGAMTEILHASAEAHTWHLVLPALARMVALQRGPVTLVGAPHMPFGPALAAQGVPSEALLWVRCEAAAARLWACEQALRCAEVAAVLAWLPQARTGELRRLQLAAAQHDALLWVFRPEAAAASSSPAHLRLRVASCADDAGRLEITFLKRRGPPLAAPVTMPANSDRLAALLAASQLRRKARNARQPQPLAATSSTEQVVVHIGMRSSPVQASRPPAGSATEDGVNALDRIAVAA